MSAFEIAITSARVNCAAAMFMDVEPQPEMVFCHSAFALIAFYGRSHANRKLMFLRKVFPYFQ
ncbi:MAG: hypothetical protein CML23_15695 [Rhizobiaceae bacterium]|nr:hypothetical protein [Rhizobiaceae bacterium]